jgi:hypothetical protein
MTGEQLLPVGQAPKWASNTDPVGALAIALAARANALEEEQGEWTWRDIAEAAHRLASTPTALPGAEDVALREAIARIVDPHGFRQWQSMYDYSVRVGDGEEEARKVADWAHGKQKEDALAKAGEILALIPRASDEVPANPVGEIEALKAELDRFRRPADRTLSTRDPIEPLPGFKPTYLLGQALLYREWCHSDLWGRPNEAELSARIAETAYHRIIELEGALAALKSAPTASQSGARRFGRGASWLMEHALAADRHGSTIADARLLRTHTGAG